ncbi:prolipoprotein diacylglyceryl transferase [Haliangium ochraceum]|uniref:Phosphatidylglycerol--prolipoprotein diacylglyceryl transferase n=1 Tax=Haliangium ochraceum (strain DSM 14365 / JCM 11303 / SMP-2) TaxID=502025 RepID=D0LNT0_HALO1|nr:prolipoprotein diacylglyceryl transferase [Haliangium ochraceum]ACY16985.1 prolipoprotein diacylglyceryl transferase [Haliangium ochraceum DSM 14365]
MKPVLFEVHLPLVGELSFPAYMSMLLVGVLLAVWVGRREATRQGLDGVAIVDLGALLLVLGVLGARLLSVLADGHLMDFVHLCTEPTLVPATDSAVAVCSAAVPCDFHYVCDLATNTCHPPRDCLAALKFWQGGLTFYGGLLLAVPGGIWFVRRRGLPLGQVLDIAAPCVMLGLGLGRIGCFLNGCCYGEVTAGPLGVLFPGRVLPVHPTQLYEALGALVLFAALLLAVRAGGRLVRARAGALFAVMLMSYGVLRFALEWLRDDPRGSLGALSTSQAISLPLIALGGLWLVRVLARSRHAPPASVESAASAAEREPPAAGD